MGWKVRNGRRYFYEWVEVDGEKVWKCLGCGMEAEMASRRVQRERAENRHFIDLVRAWEAEDRAIDKRVAFNQSRFERDVRRMYEAAGYRQHKGQWRKMQKRNVNNSALMDLKDECLAPRMSGPGTEDAKELENEIRLLTLESLRRVGQDVSGAIDAVSAKLDAMREELSHESMTAMEQVLVEQILTAWVQWYVASWHVEAEASESRNWRQNQYLERRYSRCQHRLSRLIDQLARLRCVPRFFLESGRNCR